MSIISRITPCAQRALWGGYVPEPSPVLILDPVTGRTALLVGTWFDAAGEPARLLLAFETTLRDPRDLSPMKEA